MKPHDSRVMRGEPSKRPKAKGLVPIIVLNTKSLNPSLFNLFMGAGTAASQGLAHLTNTTAIRGLTSGFGMGPGITHVLWPANANENFGPYISVLFDMVEVFIIITISNKIGRGCSPARFFETLER